MAKLMHTPKDMARELANKYKLKPTQETINSLSELMVPEQYRHRTVILNENEVCDKIYFIIKGLVRVYTPTPEGDMVDDLLHEGDVLLCKQSLFTGEPSKQIVQTLEPTVVYVIDYAELCLLSEQSPKISELIRSMFESEMLRQEKRYALSALNPKERYTIMMESASEILRRTQLKFIASYLRMAPETLSRVRNILSRK